jgi:hypothetical protein
MVGETEVPALLVVVVDVLMVVVVVDNVKQLLPGRQVLFALVKSA